jgi:hypothetical protein
MKVWKLDVRGDDAGQHGPAGAVAGPEELGDDYMPESVYYAGPELTHRNRGTRAADHTGQQPRRSFLGLRGSHFLGP